MNGASHEPPPSPECMPRSSRYRGEPIDTSSRHSIVLRPGDQGESAIGPGDTHAVIDYFYHEGRYWRAVVPLDSVQEISGQAFNFSQAKTRTVDGQTEILRDKWGLPKRKLPFLNHMQTRFKLAEGSWVQLYAMDSEPEGEPEQRINDFVYSLEAVGPVGVGFNLRDALGGNLVSTHRFLSTQEMAFERFAVESQYLTESPPLPLHDDQKRTALVQSLARSHRAGMTEPYYLYRCCGTNNCTSNPFIILDRLMDYSPAHRLGSMLYRLPIHPRLYLRVRGLDVDPRVRKMVRDEFREYVEDPRTQQRKRDYVRGRVRAVRAAREARKGTAGGKKQPEPTDD